MAVIDTQKETARERKHAYDASPGVELLFGAGRNNPDNPSLDRVVPELGYVRGNVRVISYWANRLKCDCSDAAVFRRLADYTEGLL